MEVDFCQGVEIGVVSRKWICAKEVEFKSRKFELCQGVRILSDFFKELRNL